MRNHDEAKHNKSVRISCETHVLGCHTLGINYRGKNNETIDGIPCQAWSSQTPHQHKLTHPRLYWESTVEEASSFCRNPRHPRYGYEAWPWCYTMSNSKRWDFCFMEDYCGEYNVLEFSTVSTNVMQCVKACRSDHIQDDCILE